MTDLARRDEPTPLPVVRDAAAPLIAWAQAARAAHELATPLCSTSFVPKHFQDKPGDATAAILFGAEAGLSPLQALQGIYVIGGKPAMYARTLMAVVLGAGHEVWTESLTDTKAVVGGRRRGSDKVERVEWTIERAKRAGYTKNAKYTTDPQSMLLARAQSDMCRRLAPDAILGMAYSVEELQDEDVPEAPARKVKRSVAAAPAEAPVVPAEPELEPELDAATPQPVQEAASPAVAPEPAPFDPAEPPDRPGYITRSQLRMLHAVLGQAGMSNDRDAALKFYAQHGGRIVESSKDLTRIEASRIIDALVAQVDGVEDAEVVEDSGE